jgi:hypothetical protein
MPRPGKINCLTRRNTGIPGDMAETLGGVARGGALAKQVLRRFLP